MGCGIVDEDGYATRFCQPGFVADSYRPCLAEETDEDDILSEERKPKTGLYKLNLKNVDRKFLTKALDAFLEGEINEAAVVACFEKKALWSGILHHLHYRPKNEAAEAFVRQMRGSENLSVSSRFEAHMANGDVAGAAKELGSGAAVLRHLQYLLSRSVLCPLGAVPRHRSRQQQNLQNELYRNGGTVSSGGIPEGYFPQRYEQ